MPGLVTVELLNSQKGAADGIASLDGTGKVPIAQLPAGAVETYKGVYATSAALIVAYPTASIADYAWVTATTSYWYWNYALATPAWVDSVITLAAYTALSTAEKAAVPYSVVA